MFLDTDHVEERRGAFEVAVGARTKLFTNKPLARGKKQRVFALCRPSLQGSACCLYLYIYIYILYLKQVYEDSNLDTVSCMIFFLYNLQQSCCVYAWAQKSL